MADEYIKRQGLLDAYDAAHKGPPGGARKLIAEAPAEDVVPVVRCKDCVIHGSCLTEDTFRIARIENPFCCGGKRKAVTADEG
jgi:hypothetical protein